MSILALGVMPKQQQQLAIDRLSIRMCSPRRGESLGVLIGMWDVVVVVV